MKFKDKSLRRKVFVGLGLVLSILSATETISSDSPLWRAVAIFVPKDRAVAGNVEIGQRVDLFVTQQIDVLVPDDAGKLVVEPDPASGYPAGQGHQDHLRGHRDPLQGRRR